MTDRDATGDAGHSESTGHLDDEALSASLDDDAGDDVAAHLASCAACRDRLEALRAVAVAVATPPTPDPALTDVAVGRALRAAEEQRAAVATFRPPPPRPPSLARLGAVAAVVAAVLGLGALVSRVDVPDTGDDEAASTAGDATTAGPEPASGGAQGTAGGRRSAAGGGAESSATGGAEGSGDGAGGATATTTSSAAGAAPEPAPPVVDGGDLGDVDDPDVLVERVVEAAPLALGGGAPSAAADEELADGGEETESGGGAPQGSAPAEATTQPTTAPAAPSTTVVLAPNAPEPSCLGTARAAGGPGLGPLRYAATTRFQGTPAVVLGFGPEGGAPSGRLLVLAAADCRVLVDRGLPAP